MQFHEVHEVDHHGSAAWEALVSPTETYDPRCACCPLLFSSWSDAIERQTGARERDPAVRYPETHRVRLDVRTGICVYTEQVGGSSSGAGHELVIEAVDRELPDALFVHGNRVSG